MMKIPYKSLTFWIFAGLFAGMIVGKVFGEIFIPVADVLSDVFLKLLRMAIMPLIIVSITSGVVSIGGRKNLGILGAKTFGYYVLSSLLAILTGQILVNIFRPGVGSTIRLEEAPPDLPPVELNFIPENPFAAMANGEVLPVIFFSILLGFFITQIREKHRILLGDIFSGLFDALMKMTRFIIWTAPIGVFGINAKIVATTGFDAFRSLGFYFAVVLIGLAIHGFVTLPFLIRLVTKRNPYYHYKGMPSALVMAFSTCSSVVTLPLTMQAVIEHSKVSKKLASFVLPIGATVNMDGTALYECVAVIFIAQIYGSQVPGFELTFSMQIIIVMTALLASIGAASVPMSGMVMMSIILGALNLPLEWVALILPVDRILDMFRTVINVLSDSCGSVIIAKSEGESVLEG
ncbi:dicarboxylate/amino acid:cation symporter [candidate division KSB1 bacterium]